MSSLRKNYSSFKKMHFCAASLAASNQIDGVSLFEKLLNTDKDPETHYLAFRFASYYLHNIDRELDDAVTDYESISAALNVALNCDDLAQFQLPQCALIALSTGEISTCDSVPKYIQYNYRAYAPSAVTLGCWLRNISSPATNHLDYVSPLHALHYQIIGADPAGISVFRRVSCLFQNYGIDLTSVLAGLRGGGPEVSSLLQANLYLAIGLFPRVFTAEILGITLFETYHRSIGLGASDKHGHLAELETLLANFIPCDAMSLAVSAVEKYLAGVPHAHRAEHKVRICRGYILALALRNQYIKKMQSVAQEGLLSPHNQMLALLKHKAKYAIGYHDRVRVNQKPLDKLLAEDPELALLHLAKSKYIKPGDPENSRLCGKSIAFGGPMFRIFDEQEINTIRGWVTSLAEKEPTARDSACPIKCNRVYFKLLPVADLPTHGVVENFELGDGAIRSLYYHFLNIEFFPGLLPKANAFAEFWLHRCSYRLENGECSLPFKDYAHDKLRHWFNNLANTQVQSYEGRKIELMCKERLKNASLQLCPMIFIDGAWLQKAGEPLIGLSRTGAILNKIYSDEVGNGKLEWNHPNLYRELMQEMSFALPEFDDKAFAAYSGFDDDAFLVPVFWLSVSLFPTRYAAEILGLNLAMELSGVGGSYRVAKDQLKSHGFSTLFVDLHNTIDNVSTGHSAMALDAIQIFLDELAMREGRASVNRAWERIWTGYRALVPPKGMSNFIYASIVGKTSNQRNINSSNLSQYEGKASLV